MIAALENAILSIDIFAQPVTLAFKGRRRFNTLAGGCLSLLIVLSFATYAAWSLNKMITKPVLVPSSENLDYFSPSDDLASAFNISTKNTTLAVYV